MQALTRHQLSFISYDPFADERIDPTNADNLFRHPELPDCIHDAVVRAKKLIGPLSSDELTQQAGALTKMLGDGQVYTAHSLDAEPGRDYIPAHEPDCLTAYLHYVQHEIPAERRAALFGLLALSLAGEIANTLWPSDTFIAYMSPNASPPKDDFCDTQQDKAMQERVSDLAIEAVRAIGFGEEFQAALHELETKRKNSERAKKTHKGKEPLFAAYIEWALALGNNHPYRYQSHAEADFLYELAKTRPELHKLAAASTPEIMRKRLHKHCGQHGLPYPFPKKP